MNISSTLRVALLALIAFAAASLASAARADEGTVSLTIYKAGWVIGGSGGSGWLNFHGRS
jgi:ABC-type sugar transport system substrate-binding protein